MYYYIYDSHLNEKKYRHILAKIENRLTDLGINGKINRLSFLKNIHQIMNEEVKRGVKTVVVVGNDETLGQVVNLINDLDVVIGYIPIGQNPVARLLHIPENENACDILSARIIRKLDLGKINDYYFFTSVEISGSELTLECDDNYFVTLGSGRNRVVISNFNVEPAGRNLPDDSSLDISITTVEKKFFGKKIKHESRLTGKNIKIDYHKSVPVVLTDEKRIIKTPVRITVVPKKIKVISGKII